MKGYESTRITKKTSTLPFFFLTIVLGVVFPAQTASAHEAPIISPTRLDFEAIQVPKTCNDDVTFRVLFGNWVPPLVLAPEADRRLVVRIHPSTRGEKLIDVTLLDAAGTTITQEHKTFVSNTECYKVLYEAAYAAADLLGAFEKPPPPEPLVCPSCPTCPPAPSHIEPARCPALTPPARRIVLPPPAKRRAFIGAGVFLGTGITPTGAIGPRVSFGFMPSLHWHRIQFEIDGAWAPQTMPKSGPTDSLHVDVVPLAGSLCYSRYVFRICSGMVTTFFMAERTSLAPGNDAMRITLAASLRLGTEFEIADPFSIRLDAFAFVRFWERTAGRELAALDELNPFASGVAATGVWSFQ